MSAKLHKQKVCALKLLSCMLSALRWFLDSQCHFNETTMHFPRSELKKAFFWKKAHHNEQYICTVTDVLSTCIKSELCLPCLSSYVFCVVSEKMHADILNPYHWTKQWFGLLDRTEVALCNECRQHCIPFVLYKMRCYLKRKYTIYSCSG